MTAEKSSDWNMCLQQVGATQDKAAFSRLFAHFAPLLKGFLLKGGGVDPQQAEELVQETMIKVWRKAPTYSPAQAAASTWMYTIARNTRIDWIRKHGKVTFEELSADDTYGESDAETPFSSLIQVRNQRNIKEHLNNLPQDQLQVLTLIYYQGKSGQQVADELNIPLGTVKSRVRLALQKMRLLVTPATEALA